MNLLLISLALTQVRILRHPESSLLPSFRSALASLLTLSVPQPSRPPRTWEHTSTPKGARPARPRPVWRNSSALYRSTKSTIMSHKTTGNHSAARRYTDCISRHPILCPPGLHEVATRFHELGIRCIRKPLC